MLVRILAVLLLAILAKADFEKNPSSKYKNFVKPCFEGDEEHREFCSKEGSNCKDFVSQEKKEEKESHESGFKLPRLDGVRTGHERELDLGDGKKYTLKTMAMKPLIFAIPNFLTDEQSAHIIKLAKDSGLKTSIAGFNLSMYEGDLEKEIETVDKSQGIPEDQVFATDFNAWDLNNDDVIDTSELKRFIAKFHLLFMADDEIDKMFDQLGFYGYENGQIARPFFSFLNIPKLWAYLRFMKLKHPRHRARFSKQAWLPQNKASDPVLRKLHEKVINLTKLPRKIVQGGEALQVVNYQPLGHYHIHYDSMPVDSDTEHKPCCHHKVEKPDGCRLCRYITILYYLNHVEQGGETAFIVADNATYDHKVLTNPDSDQPTDDFNLSVNCHRANLVVPPKKNMAIMWYNHHVDEDSGMLGLLDAYSLHGGCDVIKGEKWIANNWLTAPPTGREHLQSVYDVGFD